MADAIVNEVSFLINKQLQSLESLGEHLLKAEALMYVASDSSFFDNPNLTLHCYLCAVSDILEQAKNVNEKAINFLLKNKEMLANSSIPSIA